MSKGAGDPGKNTSKVGRHLACDAGPDRRLTGAISTLARINSLCFVFYERSKDSSISDSASLLGDEKMTEAHFDIPHGGIVDGIISVFRELYIEIFAVIVPGVCFIIALIPAIIIPIVDVSNRYGNSSYFHNIMSFCGAHGKLSALGLLLVSYVIGHFLFRCDPKNPDRASIKTRSAAKRLESCVELFGDGREEFPYHNLHGYLSIRGFDHLLPYVSWTAACWDGEDKEGENKKARHRSKHQINILKLGIRYYNAGIYFEIARNETHVRLMSSMWYLCQGILCLSVLGAIIGLLGNTVVADNGAFLAPPYAGILAMKHGEALLSPLGALFAAVVTKEIIKTFFHYQRVREIVYVLEAWHLVSQRFSATNNPGVAHHA